MDHDCPEVRNISTSAMRPQATEVLSTVPNVRPSSLVNLARLKHGATFSYSSAWRALQCHRQDINKADVISFGQIPYFLHEIEIANSGSTTYVAATSEETIPEIKQPGVVIVHDWEKGLQQAQRQVLSFPFESICVWHLEKERQYNIQIQVWWSHLGGSKASSQIKHNEAMAIIAAINCDAAEYLENCGSKEVGKKAISLFLDLEQSL
ncbi:hypothetical protein BASA50_010285 [Batrachochytrium salamandrivorans]|uniref:MULE transposase domain-containing protein n=1 Tax=Batrachochytrium salamandrivorans TaxID=1357716 RepID=A0ABQ8EZ11_9FUNG|nr:hypothetical protein BASA50_010285 [Batrachochytrium salamandrivorans]